MNHIQHSDKSHSGPTVAKRQTHCYNTSAADIARSDLLGFYRAACMFVRLSVKHVDCDKKEEQSVHIFIP